jgi:zinc/manganese transport system ATP-binding protein
MPPSDAIVRVQGLTVQRGHYTAVQDVSFEIKPGSSTAIVGPNGSGKSTLVQAILGLLPHAAGSVEIFGRPLRRLGNLCHQIGYMPQNFLFDRTFPISVGELVGLGWVKQAALDSKSCTNRTQAIAIALQRVNGYHLRRQAIGTLSGGEVKRVLLAYCLVMSRRLLVLDEAFAEVDIQGEAEFYSLLRELMLEKGWTVVQVSHDLDMVSRHCDQILCVNRRLICSGQPEQALSQENLLATYGNGASRYHHRHD